MAGWSARAMARHLGMPAQTLIYWIGTELVTPDEYGHGRHGHVIGVNGLMELLTVKELREANFSLQEVRRAVENLRSLTGERRPLVRLTLVAAGSDIVWMDRSDVPTAAASALQQPGQRLMVFPVGELHAEILRQLSAPEESALARDGGDDEDAPVASGARRGRFT